MGAQLCSQADTEEPLETLRFHPEAKGAQVILDAKRITAYRLATFHDGIVFSQRPVRPGEHVALRVLGHEGGWHGGLRVGFTRLNPACVQAPSLPPFVCPDLEQQSPTWAAMLPDGCALAGDVVSFWVNRHGRLCAQVNRGRRLLLRKGVPMGAPLWAVMDVYGTTKAIQLLGEAIRRDQAPPLAGGGRSGGTTHQNPDVYIRTPTRIQNLGENHSFVFNPATSAFPTASPWALPEETPSDPEATAGEECAICLHCTANTCLVPCGHTHFCSCCIWRVFRDTAKCPLCRCEIEGVVSAWGPPALRTGEGLPV